MKAWFTLTAGGLGQRWSKALAITRWKPIKRDEFSDPGEAPEGEKVGPYRG